MQQAIYQPGQSRDLLVLLFMLVDKSAIADYIPQKPPMVMVDGLVDSDKKSTTSVFRPGSGNLFCEEGFFKEPGLIENIAQTTALRAGYEAKQKKEPVKVGFIGAVKNFKVFHLPRESDQLTTVVKILNNLWNVTIVKGKVFVAGKIAAEAELSIFTQEEKAD